MTSAMPIRAAVVVQSMGSECMGQALPSVSVNPVTVNACPLAKLVLSTVMSPPPFFANTFHPKLS